MMRSVFDPVFDDLDDGECCQSCKLPLIKHLGLYGTCAELIASRKQCEELAAQVASREQVILQLSDNLIRKDTEIRELKRVREEGQ